MKATGIVRRIDDLGRVVIPKEIRRTMRIREGDPLEIFTTRDGEVIFKKYSLIGGLEDFAAQFCDTLARSSDFTAVITDRDSVIATSGPGKRELIGRPLSPELEQLMEGRSIYQRSKGDAAGLLRRNIMHRAHHSLGIYHGLIGHHFGNTKIGNLRIHIFIQKDILRLLAHQVELCLSSVQRLVL